MSDLSDFPSASALDTISFCWEQVEGQKRQLIFSWVVMVLAVVVADIACPLIFASILSRVATLPPSTVAGEWRTFGPLLLTYAVAGLIGMGLWRVAGWFEWGACVRAFAQGVNNGYEHLLKLSYRWHMDHPAGEVISSLGNFSWAFVEMVDVASWGLLPVAVVVLSAIVVLAVLRLARRPRPSGHGRLIRRGHRQATPPGAGRLRTVREPPLQGDRCGGRHGHQPDGRADGGRRTPGARPGRGPDARVGRCRPAGPFHLHANPAATGDVDRGGYPAGADRRHDHGRPPLGFDCRALPHPLLLGPGGDQPATVVRASAVLRPLAGTSGQVHGHRRCRGRDRRGPDGRRAPGAPGKGGIPRDRFRLPPGQLPLRRPDPPGRSRRARRPGGSVRVGEVHPVEAPAPVHGRGQWPDPGRRPGHHRGHLRLAASQRVLRSPGSPAPPPEHRREHLLRDGDRGGPRWTGSQQADRGLRDRA